MGISIKIDHHYPHENCCVGYLQRLDKPATAAELRKLQNRKKKEDAPAPPPSEKMFVCKTSRKILMCISVSPCISIDSL